MDAWIWIVIAAVAIAAVVLIAMMSMRKRQTSQLQERFGSEYDRTVDDAGDQREAERELRDREKRHDDLEIGPLSEETRARYADEWQGVQARFVDEPEEAVRDADRLVQQVMGERGYPTDDDFEHRAADVSVDHPEVVDNYREGYALWRRYDEANGDGQTEDLRQAMVHFRALFEDLLEADRVGEVS
ncbi:MAG: hypothetical protein H0U30_04375 [Actinobacteria bacterium]|nr:hypothetical protein [Actinomycetota bacterium]